MTPQDMAEHVAELARTHGIAVGPHSSGGRAWRRSRRVVFKPIKSAVTYATALHELGHVLGRQGQRRVDREVNAWLWAEENAIEWTPRMDRHRSRCLTSYVLWARRRQRQSPTLMFIPSDHPIFRYTEAEVHHG